MTSRSRFGARRSSPLALFVALAFMLAPAACGEPESIDDHPCPPGGTTATYDNFGKGFMESYCQSCHASRAIDRQGAPGGYNFDTRDDVARLKARIYVRAAGPNNSMPPGPNDPPKEDREKLADWLACGAN